MKATELRIGNLFIEKHSEQIIEVIELTNDNITFSGKFPYKWQAEPIPLTEEWLLKFGFEKKKQAGRLYDYYYYLNGFYYSFIDFHNIVYKNKALEGVDLKHVHSLQNLYFALTGEELTIKE